MQRQRFFTEAVLISFGDTIEFPKNIAALTSQCLAAARDMLHCFGLLPAESAVWIPIEKAHVI
jgi:hypothetical protein